MAHAVNRPNFRSAATQMRVAEKVYRDLFEWAPHPYLILSPSLVIADANAAYLSATDASRDALAGRQMFDAFPDNPADSGATGVRNLGASFERLLSSMRSDAMPRQRYDVMGREGQWRERYWDPVNWLIADDAGSVIAIVHHVTDVTARVSFARRTANGRPTAGGPFAANDQIQGWTAGSDRARDLMARCQETLLRADHRMAQSEEGIARSSKRIAVSKALFDRSGGIKRSR